MRSLDGIFTSYSYYTRIDIGVELGAEGEYGRRKVPRLRSVPRDDRHKAQGVSDWGKEEKRRRTGNMGCEVSSAGATAGGVAVRYEVAVRRRVLI